MNKQNLLLKLRTGRLEYTNKMFDDVALLGNKKVTIYETHTLFGLIWESMYVMTGDQEKFSQNKMAMVDCLCDMISLLGELRTK
jgi:hypothetical protein